MNIQHSILQAEMNEFEKFTVENRLVINSDKSSLMSFNFSTSLDFPPDITLAGEQLTVLHESKIVGLFINDRLTWDTHVDYACKKARSRIWMLRRMINLGLQYTIILDVYFKNVRSVLEYGAIVFHSGLSNKLSNKIESVQKLVLNFISNYIISHIWNVAFYFVLSH